MKILIILFLLFGFSIGYGSSKNFRAQPQYFAKNESSFKPRNKPSLSIQFEDKAVTQRDNPYYTHKKPGICLNLGFKF